MDQMTGRVIVTQQHVRSLDDRIDRVEHTDAAGHLVLAFGSTGLFEDQRLFEKLQASFPEAVLAGCTTAGEIVPSGVEDDSLFITSLAFQNTRVRSHRVKVDSMEGSYEAGVTLANNLLENDLAYLLILSDGLAVNGSSLVRGIRETLPSNIPFSGGLAGDAARFEKTLTLTSEGVHEKSVLGVGFYGSSLQVRRGSVGGWSVFGPYKTVTRSEANVVYEIDHQRALDVYSTYLGDEAQNLPASGLLFPLAMAPDKGETGLIRTLLAIDREVGSLTFAGDVPAGTTVQMMHANYDQLIDGAANAAKECMNHNEDDPGFALLISCVGRKLLLGNNTDFEVDAVLKELGGGVACAGFYSYGEIGPYEGSKQCELHNQTMTVTVLNERS